MVALDEQEDVLADGQGATGPTMTLQRWRRFVDTPAASFTLFSEQKWEGLPITLSNFLTHLRKYLPTRPNTGVLTAVPSHPARSSNPASCARITEIKASLQSQSI
jgi:hypothetical protein